MPSLYADHRFIPVSSAGPPITRDCRKDTAYQNGISKACVADFDASPPATMTLDLAKSPLQKCMLREPHYSSSHEAYEAVVADHYQHYPDDVDLRIPWLILAFSDQEHKTPEEIHRAWSEHHHPP